MWKMKKFEGMLLASDMDGTLLDKNRRISPRNEEAIRYFTDEGGLFSLATGRTPQAVQAYWAQLPCNAPCILLNGALICTPDQKVIARVGMPPETRTLVQEVVRAFPAVGCEIYAGERVFVRQMNDITRQHMEALQMHYEELTQEQLNEPPDDSALCAQWSKVNITGFPDQIAAVKRFLQPYRDGFCMASSFPVFWEITPAGVHKGAALQKIIPLCGLAPENVYAIGDSFNDEMLLRVAHTGFAPANADEAILRVAQVVVSDNNSNAVADAIDWIEQNRAQNRTQPNGGEQQPVGGGK